MSRQIMFYFEKFIFVVVTFIAKRLFDIKLFLLAIKYGGRKKIPVDEYLKGMDFSTLISHVRICKITEELHVKLKLDVLKTRTGYLISCFTNYKFPDAESKEETLAVINSANKRLAVYHLLLKYDIAEKQIPFRLPGLEYGEFMQWLQEVPDDNAI